MTAPTARPAVAETSVQDLRRALRGAVITPDDDGYDQARSAWNVMVDKRPALIAQCMDAADVAAAIGFGRHAGLDRKSVV